MISKIGEWISRNLVNAGVIRADEKELYDYGFFLLLSKTFFFIVTVLFGIAWNVLGGSILFFIQFILIRGYAGGVHASKEQNCIMFTTLSLFFSVTAIHLFEQTQKTTLAITVMLISAATILYLGPIESVEKPLTTSDYHHYKKLTYVVVITTTFIAVVLYILGFCSLLFTTSTALALESILLLLGKAELKE